MYFISPIGLQNPESVSFCGLPYSKPKTIFNILILYLFSLGPFLLLIFPELKHLEANVLPSLNTYHLMTIIPEREMDKNEQEEKVCKRPSPLTWKGFTPKPYEKGCTISYFKEDLLCFL